MNYLSDLKIDEVFSKEKADEYEKRFNLIWRELIAAHSSMFILEKIRGFPLNLFFSVTHDQNFLKLVERNFSHQVALIVANMFGDSDNRSATFNTMIEWIRKNRLPESSEKVSACLDQISYSDEIQSLQKRAWDLRRKLLAHLDWEYALNPDKLSEVQISYGELQTLVGETEKILLKIRVEGGVSLLPLDYSPLVKPGARTDIEKFLDLLAASDDSLLTEPERAAVFWEAVHYPDFKESWSVEKKKIFNDWRQRIGRKVIPFD